MEKMYHCFLLYNVTKSAAKSAEPPLLKMKNIYVDKARSRHLLQEHSRNCNAENIPTCAEHQDGGVKSLLQDYKEATSKSVRFISNLLLHSGNKMNCP